MQFKLIVTARKEPEQPALPPARLKPKKQRVANPQYRAIPLEWRLMVEGAQGLRDATLELSFRTTDRKGKKTVMSFPCFLSDTACLPRKVGTMRKVGTDNRCSPNVRFSVLGDCSEPLDRYMMILSDIIDDTARAISGILRAIREKGVTNFGNLLDGVHLLEPKVLRIPKMVTAQELSFEHLQEEGLLDLNDSNEGALEKEDTLDLTGTD